MESIKNLVFFILGAQFLASVFLIICYYFDSETFHKIGAKGHAAIPAFKKIVGLMRNTNTPLIMGLSFLSLVFVIMSYIGMILLVIQLIRLGLTA